MRTGNCTKTGTERTLLLYGEYKRMDSRGGGETMLPVELIVQVYRNADADTRLAMESAMPALKGHRYERPAFRIKLPPDDPAYRGACAWWSYAERHNTMLPRMPQALKPVHFVVASCICSYQRCNCWSRYYMLPYWIIEGPWFETLVDENGKLYQTERYDRSFAYMFKVLRTTQMSDSSDSSDSDSSF